MPSAFFRRTITLLLAAVLTLSLFCTTAFAAPQSPAPIAAANAFAGGKGTQSDPYRIEAAAQLSLLAALFNSERADADGYAGKCFALANDIALNDISNAAHWDTQPPMYAWTPIGTRRAFNGTFDGQGYAIHGMYLVAESGNAGLFSDISNAVIRNVTLTDAFLRIGTEVRTAGVVVGSAIEAEISGCTVDARIDSANCSHLGGVVGWTQQGTLRDCSFNGAIRLTGAGTRNMAVGGVAGNVMEQRLTDCVNTGALSIDAKQGYLQNATDLIDMSVNSEGMSYAGYVFAGSICGLYYYLESDAGYTPETSYIRDCSYADTHPQGVLLLPPGTGIGASTLSSNRAVSAAEANALVAKLFPAQ